MINRQDQDFREVGGFGGASNCSEYLKLIISWINTKVVKLLLERGSNVDAATFTGVTPLQVARHLNLKGSILNFTGGFKEGLYHSGEVAA